MLATIGHEIHIYEIIKVVFLLGLELGSEVLRLLQEIRLFLFLLHLPLLQELLVHFWLQLHCRLEVVVQESDCHFFVVDVLFALLYFLVEGLHPLPVEEVFPVALELESRLPLLKENAVVFDIVDKVSPALLGMLLLFLLCQKRIGPFYQHIEVTLSECKQEVVVLKIRQPLRHAIAEFPYFEA